MAVEADAVIVELQARMAGYRTEITNAVSTHRKGMADIASSSEAAEKSVQASAAKKGAAEREAAAAAVSAGVQTGKAATDTATVVATAAKRVTAAKAEEVKAVKASADETVAIETSKQARIKAAVERGIAEQRAAVLAGSGRFNTSGYDVQPGERSTAVLPVSAETRAAVTTSAAEAGIVVKQAEAEHEINQLVVDRIGLSAAVANASGAEKAELSAQLTYLRLIDQYQKAGLTEIQAQALAEKQLAVIEAERGATQRRQLLNGAERFAEGAGIARVGGSKAAIAGLATALAVAGGVEAVKGAVDFAKALKDESDALGVTTSMLQVYRAAALEVGVNQTQLSTAFEHFKDVLGQAQQGGKQQSKLFQALGVDITNVAKAGDLLPTLIQRISSIKDPAMRGAVELELFGRSGSKLDAMLSGGIDKVNQLAASMQKAGTILSPSDIATLDKAAIVFEKIKNELLVDLSRAVATNASGIISLAQAFGELAASVLNALGALGRFRLMNIVATGTPAEQHAAMSDLRTTATGRQALLQDSNDRFQALLDRHNAPLPTVTVNGRPVPRSELQQDENKSFLAQYRKLKQERAFIVQGAAVEAAGNAVPDVRPGAVNPNLLSHLKAPKGPKGPDLAKQQAERDKKFTDEMNAENDKILAAKKQETADTDIQRDLDRKKIDIDTARQLIDIDLQAKEHQIDAAKVPELKAAIRAAAAEEKRVLEIQAASEHIRNAAELANNQLQTQSTILQAQDSLATTMKARRDIEYHLLELAKEMERRALQATLADPLASPQAKALATQNLGSLDQRYDAQRENTKRNTEGPMESYLRQLKPTADQINESLQSIEAQGLQSLNDGIADAIVNGKNLGQVFHNVANQIIADLLRIAIQKFVIGTLVNLIPGLGGAGGFASKSASSFGTGALKGFASGGRPPLGGPVIVGEDGPEIFYPDSAGTIIPNNGSAMTAAHGQQAVVRLEVAPGQLFEPIVTRISGNVAVQTVMAAAPHLTGAAVQETTRLMSRPTL